MIKPGLTLENLKRGFRHPFLLFDETVLQHLYRVPATAINSRWMIGTNVFSLDWDVLILLDTCRIDALSALAGEYDFLGEVGHIRSVGGATPEWIAKTFSAGYEPLIRNTCYLTATPQARGILEERLPQRRSLKESHFAYSLLQWYDTVDIETLGDVEYLFLHEPVGESGAYGHVHGTTPPKYVTDRGISVGREGQFDRLILHYMQPHAPYVSNALAEDRELEEWEGPRPLRYLRQTGDFSSVWEAYMDDLRYVLDDVELLLQNLDANRVAITSDHGEAFGEYGIYGHAIGSLHPKVRMVPWAVTSGVDEGTYSPSVGPQERERPGIEQSTEEILADLGYKI